MRRDDCSFFYLSCMDHKIIIPDSDYNFSKITLATPHAIQGGAYFTKILDSQNDLYIQTPKCKTKQGFVRSGKKMHIDLIFDKYNEQFIEWFENLEVTLQKLIYANRDKWFHDDIDLDDIENAFINVIRTYKSGHYNLIRVNGESPRMISGSSHINIFDEHENKLSIEDVKQDNNMVCILQLHGIKFTPKTFQVFIQVKQIMVVNENIFQKCQIKTNRSLIQNADESIKINDNIESKNSDSTLEENSTVQTESETIDAGNNLEQSDENQKEGDLKMEIETEVVENEESLIVPQNEEPFESNELSVLSKVEEQVSEDIKENVDPVEPSVPLIQENLSSELQELDIDNLVPEETIHLEDRRQIYRDMYLEARDNLKQLREDAFNAYLHYKGIKAEHKELFEDESSDEEDNGLLLMINKSLETKNTEEPTI